MCSPTRQRRVEPRSLHPRLQDRLPRATSFELPAQSSCPGSSRSPRPDTGSADRAGSFRVVVAARLDVGHDSGVEAGWHVRTCCNVIGPGSKIGRAGDRRRPAAVQSTCTCPGSVGNGTVLERDRDRSDVLHAAQAHDVLDRCGARSSSLDAHGGTPVHRGFDRRVEADQLSACLEPSEEVVDRLGLGRGFEVCARRLP